MRTAVGICLGSEPKASELAELLRDLYATNDIRPWLVFVADHERELLDVRPATSEDVCSTLCQP